MTNAQRMKQMAGMSTEELDQIHAGGSCPHPDDLQGVARGRVFNLPALSPFRLWKGKVFRKNDQGQIGGLNRIGIGPAEVRRYRFIVRIGDSAFSDRKVVLLDHDLPGNPRQYQIFHDELVQLDTGLYLASSHIRKGDSLKYVCHFALDFT